MKPKIGDTVQFKKSGITGTVEKILRGACVVKTPVSRLSAWPEDLIICGLSEVSLDKEMEEHQKLCDEIMDIQEIKPIEAEMEQIIHCPEGYIFKDESGNVINATKIVLEKKNEYPKTYEECCKIMQVARPTIWFDYDDVSSISEEGDEYECHIENTLRAFRKLLICRDAYWKIAGEEMGLGKSWEPDFSSHEEKFSISVFERRVVCIVNQYDNIILTFPTREMRDAFYDNFDPDIQFCKEFL